MRIKIKCIKCGEILEPDVKSYHNPKLVRCPKCNTRFIVKYSFKRKKWIRYRWKHPLQK